VNGEKSTPLVLEALTRRQRFLRALQNFISGGGDEDIRTAIRSAILLLLVVAGFVVLKTIRDATFLSHYSARVLPTYMAWNTVVSALCATALIRVYRYVALRRLLQAGLVLFAVGTILAWDHLPGHISVKPTIFYLWVGIYGTIIPVQTWALVSTQLSTRQAKRSLGLIGSGGILGGIAGGVLARTFVNQWGVDSLFPCASLLIIFAAAICPSVSGSITESTPPAFVTTSTAQQKIHYRYATLLFLIIIAGTVVSTFLDFQFKAYTQQQVMGEKNLARFLGSFYAYLGAASLAFQLFITPLVLRKIGITAGFSTMPILLLIGSIVFFKRRSFGSIVAVRGSEELLRHSLDRSSFEVIQLALPAHFKIKLKSLIETVGARASELIACLILVAFFASGELPVSILTEWNMLLLIVWFVCAVILGSYEYPRLLREQLRREEVDLKTIRDNLFTSEFYRILPAILRNAKKEVILGILELLETSKKSWLGRYLTSLNHADAEVRFKTLQILFLQKAELSHAVKRLLQDPERRIRVEAVHYINIRAKSPQQILQKFLSNNSGDLAVKVAGMSRSLRSNSPESAEAIEKLLKEAETGRDVIALQEIAHIFQFVNANGLSSKIYKRLLSNPSNEVRKATLHSIASTQPKDLIPILLRLTRVPAIKTEVHASLAAFGKSLVPYLEEIILNPGESLPRRKLALKIAANAHASSILECVLRIARDPNLSLRFSAIKTLNRFRKKGILHSNHAGLFAVILDEFTTVETEIQRAILFGPEPDGLLNNLLLKRILWGIERVFRALALVFPPDAIYDAYLAWMSGDQLKRGAALEVLEKVLTPEMSERLLPILENRAALDVPDADSTRRRAFDSFVGEGDPLLVSAVVTELSEEERRKWLPEIEARFHNLDPVIKESLNWRRSKMDEAKGAPLTMIRKIEILSEISIFSRLSPPELVLLSEASGEISFEKGAEIYREGDPAQEMFCLIRGKVNILRNEELIETVEAGKSFGTMSVLANKNRISSAVCEEPAFCLRISSDTFWEILEDYTPVCHGIIEVLAEQVETLTAKAAGIPKEATVGKS
jgi:AAA family ATP:ADP antiporter